MHPVPNRATDLARLVGANRAGCLGSPGPRPCSRQCGGTVLQPSGIDVFSQACGRLEPLSNREVLQRPAPYYGSAAIARIENLRNVEEGMDALLEVLINQLGAAT